ncbi:hypothetical protein COW81_00195 [Candidatus Campbellbacteria bacterium CG22_combo_CG10-13_8_21_14_all_36_13]|uniref:DUF721 domain-containing protein n=1 Tax=Candidatus Campbellbacteria bacterium CG22_combo_CG10-13_8_21_14_all_36_13 TaxID=1974529 RepID=A0A2H0E0T1_9BACT|nr:MAG: hypothetical protein COW81_00195 [Candidatus Campbellbacteria bacterium CG22_combo_CG10-13_8_21_14_all_36_13]
MEDEHSVKKITDLLKRYLSFTPKDSVVKDSFICVLRDFYNIDIDTSNIKYNNNIIFLETSSVIKNVVFLNKESILNEMKKGLGEKTPKNIL